VAGGFDVASGKLNGSKDEITPHAGTALPASMISVTLRFVTAHLLRQRRLWPRPLSFPATPEL
jgi:hypothetical protein